MKHCINCADATCFRRGAKDHDMSDMSCFKPEQSPQAEQATASCLSVLLDRNFLSNIENELLKGFILREYMEKIPHLDFDLEDKARELYRNDPHFHARVHYVVGAVMDIVQRHIKF